MMSSHFDTKLIEGAAKLQPDWHFVMIGPALEAIHIPKGENIHYLGTKSYEELPAYLSGWDIALAPYREDTLSETVMPAKIPEYLAAGVRVVSAPITDVVQQYGRQGLVQMASSPEIFVNMVGSLLKDSDKEKTTWLQLVDKELKGRATWDKTQQRMAGRILEALERKARRKMQNAATAVS
jgi:glycosyltransferase involved in cell wall biosynthesis